MFDAGYAEPSSDLAMKCTVDAGAILICRSDGGDILNGETLHEGTQNGFKSARKPAAGTLSLSSASDMSHAVYLDRVRIVSCDNVEAILLAAI